MSSGSDSNKPKDYGNELRDASPRGPKTVGIEPDKTQDVTLKDYGGFMRESIAMDSPLDAEPSQPAPGREPQADQVFQSTNEQTEIGEQRRAKPQPVRPRGPITPTHDSGSESRSLTPKRRHEDSGGDRSPSPTAADQASAEVFPQPVRRRVGDAPVTPRGNVSSSVNVHGPGLTRETDLEDVTDEAAGQTDVSETVVNVNLRTDDPTHDNVWFPPFSRGDSENSGGARGSADPVIESNPSGGGGPSTEPASSTPGEVNGTSEGSIGDGVVGGDGRQGGDPPVGPRPEASGRLSTAGPSVPPPMPPPPTPLLSATPDQATDSDGDSDDGQAASPAAHREQEASKLADMLTRVPRRKKCGLDALDASFLRNGSTKARHCLAHVLLHVKYTGIPCLHMLLIMVSLLDKSGGTAGDRPITILSHLYRTLVRHDADVVRVWEADTAGPWDTAVAGASALDAAWGSELESEICKYTGDHLAALLLDMSRFFDSIRWVELVQDARRLLYPAIQLLLTMEIYMAPRAVVKYQTFSDFLVVCNSICAGCGRAVSLIRAFMYTPCQVAYEARPTVKVREYIDDLVVVGRSRSPATVVQDTVSVGLPLITALIQKGCKLADKSVVISTTARIRTCISLRFRLRGHTITPARTGRDIGADACGGRRRTVKVQNMRGIKARSRQGRINTIVRTHARAAALHFTGALPQALWGYQIRGVAPTRLQQLRSAIARDAASAKHGGFSTTTAIAIMHGMDRDPAVTVTVGIVAYFLKRVRADGAMLERINTVWSRALHRFESLAPQVRWNAVTGPLGALICTLLDMGWRPARPHLWTDHQGDTWTLDPQVGLRDCLLYTSPSPRD